MARLDEDYEVVVIDEIQMIGDRDRGYAWSRALMGLRCKEVHVCGGLEAKEVVEKIVADSGDEFSLNEYKRFNELVIADEPLNKQADYSNVQKGDCVVAFSKNCIFAIRKEIESTTGMKCCVVYGSLPPETRAAQARLFNDPDSGYDILVASDAIGMGLNLNIRRVIFHTIYKSDGTKIVRLDHSSLKQIAGRAGRRASHWGGYGEVTCRRKEDMAYLQAGMPRNIRSLDRAGLLPTVEHIEGFSDSLTNDGGVVLMMQDLLTKFESLSRINEQEYFLCKQATISHIAAILEGIPLSLSDKFVLSTAPANTNDDPAMELIRDYAKAFANEKPFGLHVNIPLTPPESFEQLGQLCSKHNLLDLYIWLALRYPGKNDIEIINVQRQKVALITVIDDALARNSATRGGKGGGEGGGACQSGEEILPALKLKHDYNFHDERIRGFYQKWVYQNGEMTFEEAFGELPEVVEVGVVEVEEVKAVA